VELSAFNLNNFLASELFSAQPYSTLVLVEYLLILVIFVLLFTQLIPVVLAHAKYLAFIAEIQTVLEPCRYAHYLVFTQRLHKLRLFTVDIIARAKLTLQNNCKTKNENLPHSYRPRKKHGLHRLLH
jgi:hypothetical protein